MKKIFSFFVAAVVTASLSACGSSSKAGDNDSQAADTTEHKYDCIAYAWEADGPLPPADMVTAINYLAGYPNETHDGIDLHNPQRLQQIVLLKKINPNLKVILSMGGAGAGSGGWSEMTGNAEHRKAFVADCKRVVDQYGLDGVDFDWEFPASAEEEANYISLFKEVREALGNDKVVSAAAGFLGNGFDMKEAMKYLDYVNMMTYDMGWQAPYHHTALRRSPLAGVSTVEEALEAFKNKGLDYKDMVLGLAFYGRGDDKNFKGWTDYRDIVSRDLKAEGMEMRWDSIACVPYIVDSNGELIIGFDNPESLKIKCDFIKEKGLRGGMYWRTEHDTDDHELTRTVAAELIGK